MILVSTWSVESLDGQFGNFQTAVNNKKYKEYNNELAKQQTAKNTITFDMFVILTVKIIKMKQSDTSIQKYKKYINNILVHGYIKFNENIKVRMKQQLLDVAQSPI